MLCNTNDALKKYAYIAKKGQSIIFLPHGFLYLASRNRGGVWWEPWYFFSWPKIWFEIIHSSHKLPSISLFFTIMIIWEKPKVVNGALVMPNRHWCIVCNVIWSMFLVRLSSMPKCIYLVHWQFHQVRLSLSTKNECLISSYREDKFQKNK